MIEGLKEIEGFAHSLVRAFQGVRYQEQKIEYKVAEVKGRERELMDLGWTLDMKGWYFVLT